MSLIKAIKHQLGLSVTPANNFTLDASADNGTMKLARGNAGATTQDIMTVAANGSVSFPQTPVLNAGGPAFRAQLSANQTGIPTSAWTTVLAQEVFDTDNAYDQATGRFTPLVPGYYAVFGGINFSSTSGLTSANVGIAKNGNTTTFMSYALVPAIGAIQAMGTVGAVVFLNGTTDYVSLYGFFSTGNTNAFSASLGATQFSGSFVRKA